PDLPNSLLRGMPASLHDRVHPSIPSRETRPRTQPGSLHGDPVIGGPLLRPDEAARLLAVKTNWIYEAVRTGRLPCLRLGRHIRFTRAMLEAWLDDVAGS
ncbi:MAG: helix-turn-helix domain-containing protein, partial [Solirubrobacteraceae bacterium]